jgi:outer membrane protein assembly factor BamB
MLFETTMRRALMLSLVVLGCDDGPPPEGTPLPTCTDCGAGAVLGGRLFATSAGVGGGVANRKGTVALRIGSRVVVFDDALMMKDWIPVDPDASSFSLDDADGLVVLSAHFTPRHDDVPASYAGTVTRYSPDLGAQWSLPFDRGLVYTSTSNVIVARPGDYLDLRASDGGVAWRKEIPGIKEAVTPDGTILVAGGFTGTLALGGTTEPLTSTGFGDYFVASFAPLTGEAVWAKTLEASELAGVAAGPGNELAVAHGQDGDERVTLFDANGNVRWSQRARLRSIQTDGERVMGADADGFAQYSATGLDWRIDARCDGSDTREILAVAEDHLVALVGCDAGTVTIGDVSYAGDGKAIVKLAR